MVAGPQHAVRIVDRTLAGLEAVLHARTGAEWELRAGRLSMGVLQEYYVTVTSKLALGLSAVEARDDVRALMT